MANGTNPAAVRFSQTLRGHLDTQGLAVHGLARRIADKRAGGHAPRKQVEQVRRDLNRYLSGKFNPGPTKRREIAVVLGLEQSDLDEEEDLLPQALLDRIAEVVASDPRTARGIHWRDLYVTVDISDVRRMRHGAYRDLVSAREIEEELAR